MPHLSNKKLYEVVILTQEKYINSTNVDSLVTNVLLEDYLIQEALEERGLTVTKKDWADATFNWSDTKSILFRSTWDYSHRFQAFSHWLDQVSQKTILINPEAQIRWNLDKHYLADLKKKGIRIVESHFIPKGSTQSLREMHEILGWQETIIKPTVSADGRNTYRLNMDTLMEYEDTLAQLIQKEDFILQPFMRQITIKGEASHIVIRGKYSHSVIKHVKKGDYRVQDHFGGTVGEHKASQVEIAFAEQAVKSCDLLPLYARVDVIWDNEDQLALSELELIEPELFLRKNEKAAQNLADAIYDHIHKEHI